MEFITKGKIIRAGDVTTVQAEIVANQDYIKAARGLSRGHVFIHELPYPNRFVKNRAAHDFMGVRMGAIYI